MSSSDLESLSERLEERLVFWLVVLCLIFGSAACTSSSTPAGNQSNANQNAQQSKPSNSNVSPPSQQTTTGSIEVTSTPAGARVLLVPSDEGGAGEPQARGVTPTTITGLAPGKYTVDLEMTGYRFFQKEVDVKAGGTARVAASLKKR